MYAIKHYMYLHKQDCELFGWLTPLDVCICHLCVCVCVCVCVSECAPLCVCVSVCVHVCPCVHRGNCLAPVVF